MLRQDAQKRRQRTRRCTRSMTTPSNRCRDEQEVRARHILVETEDQAKAIAARAEERRRLRRARQAEVEGSGRSRWRRSRLLHQGSDGAGIRRCRVQARQGQDFRSGENSVRLAHHQGRGQAQEASCRPSTRSRISWRPSSSSNAQAELVEQAAHASQDRTPRHSQEPAPAVRPPARAYCAGGAGLKNAPTQRRPSSPGAALVGPPAQSFRHPTRILNAPNGWANVTGHDHDGQVGPASSLKDMSGSISPLAPTTLPDLPADRRRTGSRPPRPASAIADRTDVLLAAARAGTTSGRRA